MFKLRALSLLVLTCFTAIALGQTAPAASGSAPASHPLPAVMTAIPRDAAAAAVVNFDLSKTNPQAQDLINTVLSNAMPGMPFSPTSLRQMVQMFLMQTGAGEEGSLFARDLDLQVGVALIGDVDISAFQAAPKQVAPKQAAKKQTAKKTKSSKKEKGTAAAGDEAFTKMLNEHAVIIIHDASAKVLPDLVKGLPNAAVKTAWWHGAKYYQLATQPNGPCLGTAGDFLLFSTNPKLFYQVTNAIEGGTGLASTPTAGLFGDFLSPNSLLSVIVPPGSPVLANPKVKAVVGPDSLAGFDLSLEASSIRLRAIGPNVVSRTFGSATDEVGHLLDSLPGGKAVLVAFQAMMGKANAAIALALYPSNPNAQGEAQSFDLAAVIPSNVTGPDGKPMLDMLHQQVAELEKKGAGMFQNITIPGAKRAIEFTGAAAEKLKDSLKSAISHAPIHADAFVKAKTLIEAEIGNSVILSTSGELVEKTAAKLALPDSPTIKAGSRILGLLQIDPAAIASILGGMWSGQGRPFGIDDTLLQLMKASTSPIELSVRTNERYDSLSLNVPVSWPILKKVLAAATAN